MSSIIITTDRIALRPIEISDLDAIHELHSLSETDEYNTLGIPNTIEDTRSVIAPWIVNNNEPIIKNYTLAIELKTDQRLIGLVGLKIAPAKFRKAEIWYKIQLNFWNQGYATEAVRTVIHYGFDILNLHRIEAGCAVDNIGSIRVLEKVGMTKEGRGRKILPLKAGWSDNFQFSILESEI
jgi:RimJ/RimL family protein N-acetyltransferase